MAGLVLEAFENQGAKTCLRSLQAADRVYLQLELDWSGTEPSSSLPFLYSSDSPKIDANNDLGGRVSSPPGAT